MKMSLSLSPSLKSSDMLTPIDSQIFNSQSSSPSNVYNTSPQINKDNTFLGAQSTVNSKLAVDMQPPSSASSLYLNNNPVVPVTTNASRMRFSPGVMNKPEFNSVPRSPGRTVSTIYSLNGLSSGTGVSIPRLQTTGSMLSTVAPLPPAVDGDTIIPMCNSSKFSSNNYQGIVKNAGIENELLNKGYALVSKVITKDGMGNKQTQYIKAINKKGQKVFILVDVEGYTSTRTTDLTLIESSTASVVPYSMKNGAYECANKDVCGVVFECGSDGICILSRDREDLSPKEANFTFVEQSGPSAAILEVGGSIMTYPVVRLSEIKANPTLVLSNTDMVTRRLRNVAYAAQSKQLMSQMKSIDELSNAFNRFNAIRESVALKLSRTLKQLEGWNEIYITNPPTSDEYKDKYRLLQYNLTQRNEDITTLLRVMQKVIDKQVDIDVITKEINDIIEFTTKEFENVEFAISE